MTGAIYLCAHDVLDETVNVVLDRLERVGLHGVNLAAAYHHSRDVNTRNATRGSRDWHCDDAHERHPGRPLLARTGAVALPLGGRCWY
jgi:hypothetical protein